MVSPFTAWGTPIAAASTTAGWAVAAASTSAGPTRLPRDLQGVVGAAADVPVAVGVHDRQSPWTQVPGKRLQWSRRSGRGPPQNPRVMPGSGARITQLTDGAPERPALRIRDVRGRCPGRAVERGRPDRREEVAADDAAADLRAAGVVDDRRPASADLAEEPRPRLGVPRLAGRAEDTERAQVMGADRVDAVGDQRPDDGRRDAEVGDAVARGDRPDPVRPGKSGAPSYITSRRRGAATPRSPTDPSSSRGP
jgi:hypothetical protein